VDAEGNYWMRSVIESSGKTTVAAGKSAVSRPRPRKRKAKESGPGS